MDESTMAAVSAAFGPLLTLLAIWIALVSLDNWGMPLPVGLAMLILGSVGLLLALYVGLGFYPLLTIGSFALGALPIVQRVGKAYASAWQSC